MSKETQPEELAGGSSGLLSSVLTVDSTHLHCCRLDHVGQLGEHSGIRSCTLVILGCNFNVFILGSQTIQKYVVNSKHLALTLLCSHVSLFFASVFMFCPKTHSHFGLFFSWVVSSCFSCSPHTPALTLFFSLIIIYHWRIFCDNKSCAPISPIGNRGIPHTIV